jgi:outer membrane protein OmpA-like peptidoglycan-associated protein
MSLLADLFSTFDKRSLTGIATSLGISEESTPRHIQSAIATVMGGMASHSGDPTLLQKLLDFAPFGKGDVSWSTLSGSIADPNSPLMGTGKRILSTLFGGAEGTITRALATGTGMQSGTTASLLTAAAPMVMSFLGRRVRDEGMSMQGLGSLLQREIPAIRTALPSGVADQLLPREYATATATVVAQTVTRERSRAAWWLPLLLLALIPAFWRLHHRPVVHVVQLPPAATGTANRLAPSPTLPEKVVLYFNTGSRSPNTDSSSRLDRFAGAVANNRDAHVTVNGYTDNAGNAASNVQLSQARADAVKDELVNKGISADRISAKGYGEENPAADNGTTQGRGLNRRVSIVAEGR